MMRRAALGRLRVAGAALVVALGLVACSGSDGSEGDNGQEDNSARSADPVASPESGDTGEEGATEIVGTIPDLGEPVANRSVTREGNTYRLDVFPLTLGDGDSTLAVNVRLVFADMSASESMETVLSADGAFSSASRYNNGFTLVDPASGTVFLPARDDEDNALCSPEMPTSASTGDELYVTCLFGGVPADVESLDLSVASFGTFDDVPVR